MKDYGNIRFPNSLSSHLLETIVTYPLLIDCITFMKDYCTIPSLNSLYYIYERLL